LKKYVGLQRAWEGSLNLRKKLGEKIFKMSDFLLAKGFWGWLE
tara:strand:- start:532 stop:660 length:129 start_codon:yes stop_codon:yes gene_type:complete